MAGGNSTVDKRKSKRKLVGQVGELAHGESKKFTLRCGGIGVEAFLISYEGSLHAYLNRCRHIALSLDWLDNQFFSDDKRFLICANHGATYEPKTGECIWGPCAGGWSTHRRYLFCRRKTSPRARYRREWLPDCRQLRRRCRPIGLSFALPFTRRSSHGLAAGLDEQSDAFRKRHRRIPCQRSNGAVQQVKWQSSSSISPRTSSILTRM